MKRIFKLIACIILSIGLVLGAYVIYCSVTYYRIEDNQVIETVNNTDEILQINKEYTIMTYNVGFGAYSQEYSFFMDSGEMLDGTVKTGIYGKAMSKEDAQKNTEGSAKAMKEQLADFYFIQEVDTDSDRSYHINMYETYRNEMVGYGGAYAVNFHSAFLALPLTDMHGKSNSGIATLSRYHIDSNVRKQYTVDTAFFEKFFDLDRCFMISRVPVEGGKELVLINSHMSAYDEGGKIREKQLAELNEVMKEEVLKGNYVIVGGDFNHDLVDSAGRFPTEQKYPGWISKLSDEDLIDGMHIVKAENAYEVATCRAAEIPYEKGINYEVVVDGFIISDNIEATAYNIDTEYMYSDHNPVLMKFTLQ